MLFVRTPVIRYSKDAVFKWRNNRNYRFERRPTQIGPIMVGSSSIKQTDGHERANHQSRVHDWNRNRQSRQQSLQQSSNNHNRDHDIERLRRDLHCCTASSTVIEHESGRTAQISQLKQTLPAVVWRRSIIYENERAFDVTTRQKAGVFSIDFVISVIRAFEQVFWRVAKR